MQRQFITVEFIADYNALPLLLQVIMIVGFNHKSNITLDCLVIYNLFVFGLCLDQKWQHTQQLVLVLLCHECCLECWSESLKLSYGL